MTKYKSLVLPLLMMLITVPILIKLGLWQLERKAEKEALVTRIEQRAQAAPRLFTIQEFINTKITLDELEYAPVTLKGSFVQGKNAQVFTNIEEGSQKFSGPGYDILSLFMSSKGGYVLVNRGFVSQEKRSLFINSKEQTITFKVECIEHNSPLPLIQTPTLTLPLAERGNSSEPSDTSTPSPCKGEGWVGGQDHEITITGLIRKPERRSYVDVADRPERKEFAIREPKAIIAGLGIVDFKPIIDTFYIDLRTPVPTGGLPQPNKTQINITNNHLQYVVTWWGFALVFTVMFGVVLVRRFKTL